VLGYCCFHWKKTSNCFSNEIWIRHIVIQCRCQHQILGVTSIITSGTMMLLRALVFLLLCITLQNVNVHCLATSLVRVCCIKISDVDELKRCINNEWAALSHTVIECAVGEWRQCLRAGGRHLSTHCNNKKLSYRRETARQLPTWRGLGPPAHYPSAALPPLATPMRMVEFESHNVPTSSVRPLSAQDESRSQGHSRSSLLVPAGIQNGLLS